MILEEETFKKFGYYPSDLPPRSWKTVLCTCDICGGVREKAKHDYRSICFNCSIHSKVRADKISEAKKGEKSLWRKGGKSIKIVCETCGKIFLVYPCEFKKGRRYCSKSCAMKNRPKEKHPSWKGGEIERICKICGKSFKVKAHVVSQKGRGIYCSRSCAMKDIRKNICIPTHHTKPELIFEQICKKNNLPFKYTGDGDFWIHNINPDFVNCNGKKIAVEIFGDYWHSPLLNHNLKEDRTLFYRKKILKKYGWELVVFWQTDLMRKDAELFILNQLGKYNAR